MAGKNQVTLTLAGDSTQLEKAFAATASGAARMEVAVQASGSRMERAMDRVNSASVFLTEGISGLGDSVAALTQLSRDSAERADRLARAQLDVEQAMADGTQAAQDMQQALADVRQATLDLEQSQRDSVQAALDVEQAHIDADAATKDYADAVKEHGATSIEARQAALDLKQAQEDLAQAQQDAKQAGEDQNQALLDQNQALADQTQAGIDAKGALIGLNEAKRAAIPPTQLQVWTERLSALAPVLFTVIGAVQLFTTAQWSLNFAWLASPITWIILGIVALVAAIVLIATKTTWFQDAWNAAWGWIKRTALDVWNWLSKLPGMIGSAFARIADFITTPFRTAFNFIAKAWNNTIGRLSWTVPGWIPGIGGNTISVPKLPTYHDGGVVPGAPGSEQLALLEAGETVIPAGQSAGSPVVIQAGGSGLDQMFLSWLLKLLRENNLKLVKA